MDTPVTLGLDSLALPPFDAVFNHAAADKALIIYLIDTLLVFAFFVWRRPGEIGATLALFAGAIATTAIETIIDVNTGVWHPIVGQDTVLTLMGRSLPLWVPGVYLVYYGAIGSLIFSAFNHGISRLGVWLWVVVPIIFDPVIEMTMLHTNPLLYYYLGNQPLVVLNFPIYQATSNAAAMILGITTLYFLRPVLKGWRILPAAMILMPFCGTMGWLATGFPAFCAINSTWPHWAAQLAGVVSILLAGIVVHAVAQLVAVDSPLYAKLSRGGLHPASPDNLARLSEKRAPRMAV